MQKKQAVEQRIRGLVPSIYELVDEEKCLYRALPINLHHILVALRKNTYTKVTIDSNGHIERYVNDNETIECWWDLDKEFHEQSEKVYSFLHDLLIENV